MKKIIVTGCAGFIGSWICDKALLAGYEVIGIDNLSSGINFTPKEVEFYKADLNSDIKSILDKGDAIVHAAAYADLRHNWDNIEQRQKIFHNNEMATRSVLEQMPNVPIIFLSSASVCGSLSNGIKNEMLVETDVGPELIESPYAASKLACEAYVAAWSFKRKTPWYCLRLVNQVGARGHHGVIYDFYNMVKKNNHIHALDNGEQKKNWVHVEDTADAIITILNKNNVPSGIYTVTSSERWSWKDIVDVMYKMYSEKYPNSEKTFTLTYEDKLTGSVGDPINLYVSGDKIKPYYSCNRLIDNAVREALLYIGWTK